MAARTEKEESSMGGVGVRGLGDDSSSRMGYRLTPIYGSHHRFLIVCIGCAPGPSGGTPEPALPGTLGPALGSGVPGERVFRWPCHQAASPLSFLNEAERHPITTILCVGAIATFIAQETGRSVDHMILTPLDALAQPWRYVTTIFPHAGLLHLGFNLLWTWQLGRAIEARLGLLKMVGLTLLAALAASGTELLLFNAPVGLSGVVYAFAAFAWSRSRHDPRFTGIIDKSTMKFLGGWFLLCIVATQTGVMRVANGAHGGGAVIGFLLGLRRPWAAPAFLAALLAAIVLRVGHGNGSMPAWVLHQRAEAAIDEGDNALAISLYEQLFANGDSTAGAFYNYGLALNRSGRGPEATDAFIRSYELDPQVIQNPDLRRFILDAKAARGN